MDISFGVQMGKGFNVSDDGNLYDTYYEAEEEYHKTIDHFINDIDVDVDSSYTVTLSIYIIDDDDKILNTTVIKKAII